eukprot:CAMPEP_0117441966 /NCGR_PEP_ID=MMETSP0759-20121206/3905_1 /TAXON_ID=63605 /ORGANISM="Percolomonas cosmopolitus, Strain WS" /LENGTH=986 /DNA_ID=CAMNT_0005233833 /DNA_START=107 /DNA_END=3067 /DNA_ORIENTATION=+
MSHNVLIRLFLCLFSIFLLFQWGELFVGALEAQLLSSLSTRQELQNLKGNASHDENEGCNGSSTLPDSRRAFMRRNRDRRANIEANALSVVFTVGNNDRGQLGTGNQIYSRFPQEIPATGAMKSKQIALASGGGSYSMFLDQENHVYAVGDNDAGQLGDSSNILREIPVSVPSQGTMFTVPIYRISSGYYHSLFLDIDGVPYSTGYSNYGQTCLGHKKNINVPQKIEIEDVFILDIAAGVQHSLLVSSSGEVYGCGDNRAFQLGSTEFESTTVPRKIPPSGDMFGKDIVMASAGYFHSLFLDRDGQVYATGSGNNGRLGNGTSDSTELPIAIPPSGDMHGKMIQQVLACSSFSLFLDQDGAVYGVGSNRFGQLGLGDEDSRNLPIRIAALDGVTIDFLACGWDYSLFLDVEGNIWGSGRNDMGTLGIMYPAKTLVLVPVKTMRNITNMAAGTGHTMFIGRRPCEPGQFLYHGTECIGCPEGAFCVAERSYYPPLPCPDSHWSKEGATLQEHCKRELCPMGSICMNAHMEYCPNKTWRHTDQDMCVPCASHVACSAGVQLACEGSLYCQGGGSCSECSLCAKDHYVVDRAGSTSCRECPSSYTCPGDGTAVREENIKEIILALAMLMLPIAFGVVAVSMACIICVCGCMFTVSMIYRARRMVKRNSALTSQLLEGFERDVELDQLDADVNRAKVIIRKSLLEIEYNELKMKEKIGMGGSETVVFLAEWNNMEVAVKVYSVRRLTGTNNFDDFEREMSIMGALRHPRLVNFYGTVLVYPRLAIVMEYCPNGTLSDLICESTRAGKILERAFVVRLLREICEGMIFLHNKGVIHRDLKSENVLLAADNSVRIADFGLARHIEKMEEVTHMTGAIGTHLFTAPEVANREMYDEKCDVYSFSMMAYQLCTGQLNPFGEDMPPLRAQALSSQDPAFRPDLKKIIDREQFANLSDLVKRCWDHDPVQRPSFEEILDELKAKEVAQNSLKTDVV